MLNSFDTGIASYYGLHEAIMLHFFLCEIEKKQKSGKKKKSNFREGKYWVRKSYHQLTICFDYFTKDQVRYALKHLEQAGLIEVRRFGRDLTKWYTLTDRAYHWLEESEAETEYGM